MTRLVALTSGIAQRDTLDDSGVAFEVAFRGHERASRSGCWSVPIA